MMSTFIFIIFYILVGLLITKLVFFITDSEAANPAAAFLIVIAWPLTALFELICIIGIFFEYFLNWKKK